jgi:S1-C subfamily serine protease
MKTRLLFLSLCVLAVTPAGATAVGPENSVVRVTASVRYPNPVRPWTKTDTAEVQGTGVVIGENQILTNAHLVLYATEVYVQPRNGGERIEATVKAVGPDVDLAVLTPKEAKAFPKIPPLVRAKGLPQVQDSVTVYGFPVGGHGLAVTRGAVARIAFGAYYDGTPGLVIQVSAAINPGNSGGPAVVGNQMVGLVFSRLDDAENTGYVIPNEEIDYFLANIRDGHYPGKPVEAARTQFQALANAALRRMLKVDPGVKGILVCPPQRPPEGYPLKPFDILVRIGSYDIDNDGMVRLENGFRFSFLYLIPKLASDRAVPVTVLRQGRHVETALPVTRRDNRLIRDFRGEPSSYFIHGPLVFSPARAQATPLYARLNPNLLAGQSPLITRESDRVRFPGEELVVVTAPMFHHQIARGYADPVGRVVREVNGVPIRNLRHLVETLRRCDDQYLVFRFADDAGDVLVFDRQEMAKATAEILEDHGIAPSRRASPDLLQVWSDRTVSSR